MNESGKRFYFSVIKLCCILILIIYYVSSSGKSLHRISVEWFLLALTLVASLGYEMSGHGFSYIRQDEEIGFKLNKIFIKENSGKRFFFLCVEFSLTLILITVFSGSDNGLYLLPFVVLDAVVFFDLPFPYSLLSLSGILLGPDNFFNYLIYCLFIIIIYYQNFMIIEKYKKYLEDFEKEEYQLKDSIDIQDALYQEQLEKSSLSFENKMLEEKSRLAQALHDKLGHSINGSVYQLEACKILMEKDPGQSIKIIQAVIDSLRTCMDEIRGILRKEKPDKKRMANLQLIQLCADCREKYGIDAQVQIKGEDKEIPEILWDAILDNTIEAVTNALKYSKCTRLAIEIVILHKVVRCSINDNGIGCSLLNEGMGIQGMKNRMRKVNGYIDINSDSGFHINMIFPLG